MKIYKDGEVPVFAKNSRVRFRKDVFTAAPKAGETEMGHSYIEAGTLGTITEILPYVVVSVDTGNPQIRKQIAWHQSVNISEDLELVTDGPHLVVVE